MAATRALLLAVASPASNALVVIRRSEPRSELAVSVGGSVTDQPGRTVSGVYVPARDGLQRGALELEGSWAPSPRWEIYATLNALAYRWLLIGGQENRHLALGSATVGSTWVPISLPRGQLDGGVFVRLLLPTSDEIPDARAVGAQVGFTFRGVATRWLAWYGGVSFRATRTWGSVATPVAVVSAEATQTGGSAAVGVAFVPASWVRLVAQCTGNVPFGRGTDQISPAAAVRFVNGPFAAELGVVLPLGGVGRSFGSVARVSWRLGG